MEHSIFLRETVVRVCFRPIVPIRARPTSACLSMIGIERVAATEAHPRTRPKRNPSSRRLQPVTPKEHVLKALSSAQSELITTCQEICGARTLAHTGPHPSSFLRCMPRSRHSGSPAARSTSAIGISASLIFALRCHGVPVCPRTTQSSRTRIDPRACLARKGPGSWENHRRVRDQVSA